MDQGRSGPANGAKSFSPTHSFVIYFYTNQHPTNFPSFYICAVQKHNTKQGVHWASTVLPLSRLSGSAASECVYACRKHEGWSPARLERGS